MENDLFVGNDLNDVSSNKLLTHPDGVNNQ